MVKRSCRITVPATLVVVAMALTSNAFVHQHQQAQQYAMPLTKSSSLTTTTVRRNLWPTPITSEEHAAGSHNSVASIVDWPKRLGTWAASAALVAALAFGGAGPALAENELSDIYGGKGFDSSLVDQTCLVDKCSVQAKACLADDPSCRKGLTCTAKCLGDNSCITGCMARYGNKNLDGLLKCTVEDHECIKIAILPGGADRLGQEPRAPKATVQNFDYKSLQGTWYKVVGFNPNYDCYACQRNTFAVPEGTAGDEGTSSLATANNKVGGDKTLAMSVEFSMPHLLPDGSPPPPRQVRESMAVYNTNDGDWSASAPSLVALEGGFRSIGLNQYNTNEVMVFDNTADTSSDGDNKLVLHKGQATETQYSRTAHSEGEMFGLKFWENWYIIGENDPGMPEFKFVYYNGKTRQNTYEGAFVYSRSRSLEAESMAKVYAIAREAGMNPDQFCRIRNGCFDVNGNTALDQQQQPLYKVVPGNSNNNNMNNEFRGIIASTKVSELLGVEAVSAREEGATRLGTSALLQPPPTGSGSRPWWYEVGDYLENPHRHFDIMDSLRMPMDWPEHVKSSYKGD